MTHAEEHFRAGERWQVAAVLEAVANVVLEGLALVAVANREDTGARVYGLEDTVFWERDGL